MNKKFISLITGLSIFAASLIAATVYATVNG